MRSAALTLVLTLAAAPIAAAHFGPAEPPEFTMTSCITVVDLRTTQELMVPYQVGFDDTEQEIGHIFLKDSKTHQFYAFRGAVVPWLPRFDYLPFDKPEPKQLPLWIDIDDVMRAQAVHNPEAAPDFHPERIGDNFLHTRADLMGQWLAITPRMPITIAQAEKGASWALSGVAPGVYQLVSYTFSPPYNDWQPRPGVVKVVDGSFDPPAVVVDSVDGMIYGNQGWRVTGCVDTEPGSMLSVSYNLDGEATSEWRTWREPQPVSTGPLDVCFGGLDPQLSGIVRLRVAITSPNGHVAYAYTPDTLVLVAGSTACAPGDKRCCEPAPAAPPPTAAAGHAATAGSGAPQAGLDQALAGAAPVEPAPAGAPAPAPAPTAATSSSGCSAAPQGARSWSGWWLMPVACLLRRRRAKPARAN